MKKLIAFATLSLLSLSADYHDPSITLGIDNRNTQTWYQLHLEIEHQSTLKLDESSTVILHGLSRLKANETYHHELGVGYRTTYEDFDLGVNVLYANQYAHSFFNHNIVPGIEVFYQDFMLAFNHYVPVKTSVEMGDKKYSFHAVSEITLSYRLSEKYEFSFTPYFNYETKKLGYAGSASAFVFDNVKLTLTPYCEPNIQHGFAFSIGYHFGGTPGVDNRKLSKSHRFFYACSTKEVIKPAPCVISKTDDLNEIINSPVPEVGPVKPTPKAPIEPTWLEKLLGIEPKSGKK